MSDKKKRNMLSSSAVDKSNLILWIDIMKDVRDALKTSTKVVDEDL